MMAGAVASPRKSALTRTWPLRLESESRREAFPAQLDVTAAVTRCPNVALCKVGRLGKSRNCRVSEGRRRGSPTGSEVRIRAMGSLDRVVMGTSVIRTCWWRRGRWPGHSRGIIRPYGQVEMQLRNADPVEGKRATIKRVAPCGTARRSRRHREPLALLYGMRLWSDLRSTMDRLGP
jgi:hypothetical protein